MQPRPLPYNSISQHYKKIFGGKVYKIPLSIAEDCPNRQGLRGMSQCVFCDEWGSAARSESLSLELTQQILKYKTVVENRFHAEKFLAYFQSYTSTFLRLSSLRAHFDTALSFPFIHGLVIGTRPDCVSKAVLDMWTEYAKKTYLSVEIGVQSFYEEPLRFLARGHSGEDSIRCIEKIYKSTQIPVGIHLMFGVPGESDEQILSTAKLCNTLPVQSVKLHNLHVLRNTPLEDIYSDQKFTPLERPEYARRLAIFLDALSPDIYVERLSAYAPRWSELVAPQWTADKMGTQQALIDYLHSGEHHQGKNFKIV